MGESYDATHESAIKDWSTADYDDSDWKKAMNVLLEGTAYSGSSADFMGNTTNFSFDKLALIGQIGNNAGIYKILTAQNMKEIRKGVYVYNMGQNLVGVPRITIANGHAGDTITLRYSEMLYPDLKESGNNVGMIMTQNYRAALSQDIYTMKDGNQVYQPRFTSHGYQYIEITGIDEPLPLEAVQGVVISSVRELTAEYETSNKKVNQLWSNLTWSNIDNFLSIPTDCPQRNERMGWSGDISVFSRTATYVSNSDQFLRRHMFAMRDVQSPAGKFADVSPVGGGFGGVLWGSAGITVPWEAYLQYGDLGLLEEHYNAMVAYIDYLSSTISKENGLSKDGQLGDWLGPQNNQLGSPFLATAYHIFDLEIMVKVAEILRKENDAERFRKMYNERKTFFNTTFINQDHKTLSLVAGGSGLGNQPAKPANVKLADTQTSYAVGLALGAFSDENIPYMANNLAETVKRENKDDGGNTRPAYSLMTGFIGTAWISKALSDHGYSELAYRLLQSDKYPSWLYAVDQGATTIWERLNGFTVENGFGGNNSMNSFNHYSFGAVGQWMMAYSLGIQRDEPGFKKFILQPEPDPTGLMTWAKGYYDSMYGRIKSEWKINSGVLTYSATVPANATATLCLPAVSVKAIKEGGKPVKKANGVKFVRFEGGKAVYELKSGSYVFVSEL
jgi:alpha-L-rhamnosidase